MPADVVGAATALTKASVCLCVCQTSPEQFSLEEAYERVCAINSLDPDSPLTLFRNQLGRAKVLSNESKRKTRLDVSQQQQHRPLFYDDVLSRSADLPGDIGGVGAAVELFGVHLQQHS